MPSNQGKTEPFRIQSQQMLFILLTFMQIQANIGQRALEGKYRLHNYRLQLYSIFSHSPGLINRTLSLDRPSVRRPSVSQLYMYMSLWITLCRFISTFLYWLPWDINLHLVFNFWIKERVCFAIFHDFLLCSLKWDHIHDIGEHRTRPQNRTRMCKVPHDFLSQCSA